MEDRQNKRERDDDNAQHISKKLCNLKEDNVFKIPVGGKQKEFGTYALCSAEDFDGLSKYSWYWSGDGYPTTTLKGCKSIKSMSRLIMQPEKGKIVDHINRDKKDNRRENLRCVTHAQNNQNRTKKEGCSSCYNGVVYEKHKKKFIARLTVNSLLHSIGTFDDEIDAAKAFDIYVTQNREKFGLCHALNFPDDIDLYKNSPTLLLKRKRESAKFRYVAVQKGYNRFSARVDNGKERIYLGSYLTAEEAAKVADNYIVQNNLDRKLNFPEDHPHFNPPKKVKLHKTEIDLSKADIRDIIKNIGEHSELADIDPEKDLLIKIGGENSDKYTIIERADYESIKYFTIRAPGGYALLSKLRVSHMLSRFLFHDTITKDEYVDHIFANTFDNRRRFLKVVSAGQNNRNRRKSSGKSSKFSGVSKIYNGYYTRVINNRKDVFRKSMKDELEAARIRDLFIIHNYPNDNYRMNFKDWDEDTIKFWTSCLKEQINWDTSL
jgi:hypothetical protein